VAEGGVLPPAIQEFVANAEQWIAGIDEMIAANDRLLASIEEVKAAAETMGAGADVGAAEAGAAGAAADTGAEAETAAADDTVSDAQERIAETGAAASASQNDLAASVERTGEAAAVADEQLELFSREEVLMAQTSGILTEAMETSAQAAELNAEVMTASMREIAGSVVDATAANGVFVDSLGQMRAADGSIVAGSAEVSAALQAQIEAGEALTAEQEVEVEGARLAAEVQAQMAEASGVVTESLGVQARAVKLNSVAYAEFAETAEAADAKVAASNTEVDESATGMGLGMKTALLAVGVGLAVGIDKAEHFQEDLVRLQTAAGLTGANMGKVAQEILQVGDATGFTGDEIATALYHPISAGLNLATSLRLVTYAAELAQVHGADLEDTTYALSSIMKAYNLNLSQVGHTAGLVNAIVGEGDMRFQAFNSSVQAWTPTMASMGITIQSAGAALDYLTDRGMSATQAATRLSMGLTMVTSGSIEANTFLKALGLTSGSVALKNENLATVMNHYGLTTNKVAADLKKPDGIYVALGQIKSAFEASGLSASQANTVMAKIFGGGRTDKAIVDLMQNLTGVKTKYNDIGKAVSNFGNSWSKTESTAHFHWTEFKSDIANLVTEFGMALLPTFNKVIAAISKGMAFLTAHPALAKLAGAILAVAGAAAIAGPVVAGLATAVGILLSPVTLIVAAIALLAIGIYLLWTRCKAFRDAVRDVANALRNYWNWAWNNAAQVIKWFVNGPLKWVEAQINMFKQFWANNGQEITRIAKAVWVLISDDIITYWTIIQAFLKAGLDFIEQNWRNVWTVIADAARLAWDMITQVIHIAITLILGIIQIGLQLIQGHWHAALVDIYNLTGTVWHEIGNLIHTIVFGFVGMLTDAGRALIQGFISGMKDMMGAVTSTAESIGKQALSAVKSVLGIFSPSQVMYQHGRNVVLGFVNGITDNLGLVSAAMGRLGTNTAGGLYGSPGRPTGLASGQNIQVQVNLGQTMSTAAWQHGLQQQIQQAVLDYAIRNPSSGLVLPAKGR
jgi:TP901 family phage tail tape measure protein